MAAGAAKNQPAANPSANLRRLGAPPPSQGRRLSISGSAAFGILTTLPSKRENDTAKGPFLGKGLPTGLGLADGELTEAPQADHLS